MNYLQVVQEFIRTPFQPDQNVLWQRPILVAPEAVLERAMNDLGLITMSLREATASRSSRPPPRDCCRNGAQPNGSI